MENEYIKIYKKPAIQEMTDKWGQGLGKYYVNQACGYVRNNLWEDLYLMEHYSQTEEGKAEEAAVIQMFKDNNNEVDENGVLKCIKELSSVTPLLSRVVKHGMLRQFNMWINRDEIYNENDELMNDIESEYVRSFAIYNEVTLHEWTPDYDQQVKLLQVQCDLMNDLSK